MRFKTLKSMQELGLISELRRQVKFELIPVQRIDGKVVERAASYVADFVYTDENGATVVEDTKGVRTRDYILKRKLMLQKYGIRLKET